jgi:hypothetical protein
MLRRGGSILVLTGLGFGPLASSNPANNQSVSTVGSAAPASPGKDAGHEAVPLGANSSTGPPIDQSTRPFKVYKDPDASWLTVSATLSNPLFVAGTVTAPNATVFQMTKVASVNGTVTLSLTLGRGSQPGSHTVYINATKLPVTSPTRMTVRENFVDHVPFHGQYIP